MTGQLPPEVIARCAATTGTYGGCHGATASGTNELAADNLTESLAALAADMRARRALWDAEQEADAS